MRQLLVIPVIGLAVALLSAAQATADSVEVKGPHICCGACSKAVAKILAKVEGVSEVSSSKDTKTVKFTAKNEAAAKAGVKALIDGGFFGSATCNGKKMKIDVAAAPKAGKADVVIVKDVHVCCGGCQTGVRNAIKGPKVTFEGSGAQRTVRIEGAGLEPGGILQALRKAGFNGTLQK